MCTYVDMYIFILWKLHIQQAQRDLRNIEAEYSKVHLLLMEVRSMLNVAMETEVTMETFNTYNCSWYIHVTV